ncbi:MAG: hypothetical protein AB7L13_15690 [Acidimicrobiia bacterium]
MTIALVSACASPGAVSMVATAPAPTAAPSTAVAVDAAPPATTSRPSSPVAPTTAPVIPSAAPTTVAVNAAPPSAPATTVAPPPLPKPAQGPLTGPAMNLQVLAKSPAASRAPDEKRALVRIANPAYDHTFVVALDPAALPRLNPGWTMTELSTDPAWDVREIGLSPAALVGDRWVVYGDAWGSDRSQLVSYDTASGQWRSYLTSSTTPWGPSISDVDDHTVALSFVRTANGRRTLYLRTIDLESGVAVDSPVVVPRSIDPTYANLDHGTVGVAGSGLYAVGPIGSPLALAPLDTRRQTIDGVTLVWNDTGAAFVLVDGNGATIARFDSWRFTFDNAAGGLVGFSGTTAYVFAATAIAFSIKSPAAYDTAAGRWDFAFADPVEAVVIGA